LPAPEVVLARRILIVDDALFMRNMLRDIFTGAGYEVVGEAENGHEAVRQYQQLRPDLVTMDIVMCSALGQETMVMEALQNGACDFIVKPFQPQQVLEVVARVLC
jgi:two-component system chemotaxis response regulator CheY